MRIFLLGAFIVLSGCGSPPRPGGYYKDDGPHERPPANLERVADAVPRNEPLSRGANQPYERFGKRYVPLTSVQPFKQRGLASWYGKRYHGQKTSNGETYDMYAMSAAHPTLPIPSYARVTNVANRKSVVVRINDRGPFKSERIIDLSYVAAHKLGFIQAGQAQVEVEAIVPGRSAGL
jgi:rare lipoprotein A